MSITLFATATEYVSNAVTLLRGEVGDITLVGVYHTLDPDEVPQVDDFTTVTLVDGTADPPDDLAQVGVIDVLSLIGTKEGADLALAEGDWQRWILLQTATEDVIRKVDVITVLGVVDES